MSWYDISWRDFACFTEGWKVREGFNDPDEFLAKCGAAIVTLLKVLQEEKECTSRQVAWRDDALEKLRVFEKLSRAVQSETEKALIRRCGELEAENLLLRAGVGVVPVEPDDSDPDKF